MINKLQSLFDKRIISINEAPLCGVSSINNRIALGHNGIYRLCVDFEDGSSLDCIRKTKAKSIISNGIRLISGKSAKFTVSMTLHKKILGYNKSCTREIMLYNKLDRSLLPHIPEYYGSFYEPRKKLYSLILRQYDCPQREALNVEEIRLALDALLDFHIFYYGRDDLAKALGLNIYSPDDYRRAKPFIRLLFHADEEENRRCFSEERLKKVDGFIDEIEKHAARFSGHRSFSHNDFTRRNLFFAEDKVLIYDFELAAFQNPEHDLIELLIHEADHLSKSEIFRLIEYHRTRLFPHAEPLRQMSRAEYIAMLLFNAYEFIAIRLSLLRIAGKVLGESFVDALLGNADRITDYLEEEYEQTTENT